ncbi:MAG: hypothetical protein IKU69_04620 [Roseburia sp.]|nr:hypothetical protein [Roseburia sp.]
MTEKLVIVPRKQVGIEKTLVLCLFAMSCSMTFMSLFVSPIFSVPAIIAISLWVWRFRRNIEFEYTYYDGDLNFARIINKAKRKNIVSVNMEDVLTIAPRGDRSIYKYENDSNYRYKDLTSGVSTGKVYAVIFKGENGMCRYEFEPDEPMLDAIRVKYPRAVVK